MKNESFESESKEKLSSEKWIILFENESSDKLIHDEQKFCSKMLTSDAFISSDSHRSRWGLIMTVWQHWDSNLMPHSSNFPYRKPSEEHSSDRIKAESINMRWCLLPGSGWFQLDYCFIYFNFIWKIQKT